MQPGTSPYTHHPSTIQEPMPNYNDIEHLEAFLQNRMDEPTRRAFEQQLNRDPTLQKELEAYRKIFSGLHGLNEEHFAAEVARWAGQKKSSKSPKQKIMKQKKKQRAKVKPLRPVLRKIAIAAGVVLLIAAGILWLQSRQFTNEQLAVKAYIAPLSGQTMGVAQGDASVLVEQFETGHQLFQEGKYEEAAATLKSFISGVETNKGAFDGLTLNFYMQSAQWTMLLAEFAEGKISKEKMKTILAVFSKDPNSEYSKKAIQLLKALDAKKGK